MIVDKEITEKRFEVLEILINYKFLNKLRLSNDYLFSEKIEVPGKEDGFWSLDELSYAILKKRDPETYSKFKSLSDKGKKGILRTIKKNLDKSIPTYYVKSHSKGNKRSKSKANPKRFYTIKKGKRKTKRGSFYKLSLNITRFPQIKDAFAQRNRLKEFYASDYCQDYLTKYLYKRFEEQRIFGDDIVTPPIFKSLYRYFCIDMLTNEQTSNQEDRFGSARKVIYDNIGDKFNDFIVSAFIFNEIYSNDSKSKEREEHLKALDFFLRRLTNQKYNHEEITGYVPQWKNATGRI